MKISRKCLKYNSKEIVRIPSTKNTLQGKIALNGWNTKYLLLDRYVCLNCGFYEEYVHFDKNGRKWINELSEKNNENEQFDEFV